MWCIWRTRAQHVHLSKITNRPVCIEPVNEIKSSSGFLLRSSGSIKNVPLWDAGWPAHSCHQRGVGTFVVPQPGAATSQTNVESVTKRSASPRRPAANAALARTTTHAGAGVRASWPPSPLTSLRGGGEMLRLGAARCRDVM